MREIWKSIKGFEGIYEISNHGNVKSLKRKFQPRERILRPGRSGSGYLTVALTKHFKAHTYQVHSLVAFNFLNYEKRTYQYVVNHKDFDRENNNLDNINIITCRENGNLKHIKSSSKYVGVYWCKPRKKWVASILINKKRKYLGGYNTEIKAYNAYQKELQREIKNLK